MLATTNVNDSCLLWWFSKAQHQPTICCDFPHFVFVHLVNYIHTLLGNNMPILAYSLAIVHRLVAIMLVSRCLVIVALTLQLS